ncbi:YcaO-like family protein [Halalkalicoccus salilacus]|uniref:YcaO-like family protein n=1 Tax=Halalkalicoccus salilacus TaxID=3117459 RepID=UPI00300EF3D9
MSVTVGIVGSGPAAEAIEAALGDAEIDAARVGIDGLSSARLGVVIGRTGDDSFERANDTVDGPWVAIELGGIGGRSPAGVAASVAGFTPETGCYACLRTRVAAGEIENAEVETGPRSARLAGAIAGHELVSAFRGEETPLLGGVIELPYTQRRLFPVPTCSCGERTPAPDRSDRPDRSLEEAIARAEAAVDERVGIVREVGEVSSFPAPYYLAMSADTEGFSDASAADKAAGVAEDWNTAYMRALGEALERYSAGVYRSDDFECARTADRSNAVSPTAFAGVEDDDGEVPWVDGGRLDTGESVSLPAEFVHFPPPEKRFGSAITTGLGLGSSPDEALLSGLYETIERDATMLAWYSTFDPLELAVDDGDFETLSRRAASEGLSVTPLLMTQDVDVPVVAVAVHREEEWPRFAMGSDADLDASAAARSALCEALQNWMELRSMGPEDAESASGWIGRYGSFPDSVRTFLDVDGRVDATAVGPDGSPEGGTELDAVIGRVVEAGLTPYAAWLTTRDVRDLGFEVARVLVPEAQPLFTREPVFAERARTVPRNLGFEPRPDREPHPYP